MENCTYIKRISFSSVHMFQAAVISESEHDNS